MSDDMQLSLEDLEDVSGGKAMPRAAKASTRVSTTIDSGMIDFTRQGSGRAPKVDSGMIDFTGQGSGRAPKVDSGMIDFTGQSHSGPPLDYGPFTPRNMPR